MPLYLKRQFDKLAYLFCCLFLIFSTASSAGWEVTWIDKFDGTSVNWDNWTAQTQANYNNEIQCYTDDDSSANRNYEVSDGSLKIIARRQDINCPGQGDRFREWTSGRLNSKDKAEFLYGRVEARIRFLELKGGTWPAFWMLENRIAEQPIKGDNDSINWPNFGAGEIDVWEWYANNGDRYITNFFNVDSCGAERRINYPNGAVDVTEFNVYAVEWDQDNIKFFMNDQVVAEHDLSTCSQYEEPMFVLINVAIGGTLGGAVDPQLDIATMEVDYVAHCSATSTNSEVSCNESTPMIVDDDNDGVANSADQCPDTPLDTVVDTTGCTVFTSPQSKAPTPEIPASQVISLYSDAYDNISGVDMNPNWGQVTQVTEVDIDSSITVKYENLNYQGISYEGNKQDVSTFDSLHVDYWTHNSTDLRIFLISPGPRENPFAVDIIQQQWNSLKIPLSHYQAVDLTDTFQMKFEGNGTVYVDNIYFSTAQSDDADAVNSAPSVTLTVQQANQTIDEIDTSAGQVLITAEVSDANADDTHTFAWSITGVNDFTSSDNTLTFDPSDLDVAQVSIEVTVTDNGTPSLSAQSNLELNVTTPQSDQTPNTPAQAEQSSGGGTFGFMWLLLMVAGVIIRRR